VTDKTGYPMHIATTEHMVVSVRWHGTSAIVTHVENGGRVTVTTIKLNDQGLAEVVHRSSSTTLEEA